MAEFSGTFLMVFIGCGSIAMSWSPIWVSLSFGLAVFLAIMIFQPISGAHINPAVSIAFAANGDLETKALPGYIISQCIGAWFAALIVVSGETIPKVSTTSSWMIEISITLLLMYSIHVLVRRKASLFYLALGVGSMVALLAFIFGKYTGASMNPARTFGPNLVSGDITLIPIYFMCTIFGAMLAVVVERFIASTSEQPA